MVLKKFEITETLYESSKTLIYKAIRRSDSRSVIIKMRKNPEDDYLLKHEYQILKQDPMEGVANVINLVYGGETTYLILEDKQGIVLNSYIKNKSLTQREFITIAKNAASALASIHSHNIIHRDIKPANMLIDENNLNIWFIDFGISININEEYKLPRDGLAGTLEFISPEQTGRVNLPIDYRSDLYSLGITLYYLLTKQMPFDAKTSMQLIHSHIAVMPPAPTEIANVNPVLSNIVMTLIQKSPEERYQSAASLEYDLSLCLSQLNNNRILKDFPLRTADSFVKLVPDDFLMGKESQLRQLKNIFDRISGQRAEVAVITGPPYSGKSGLTREFEEYVSKSGGMVFKGIYDYKKRNEPYYAVNRAFRQYYNQLVNMGTDLSGLKRALLYNLGENAAALFIMMPFLKELLGEQPPLIPLPYREEKRRNQYVFSTFLQIVTSAAQPLVLLLDNVQSADRQSLQLFVSALKDENIRHLMIVLSMRSNEIDKNPLIAEVIEQFKEANVKTTFINLEYLTLSEIKDYLDDLFGEHSLPTDELAEYVLTTTGGRPYEVSSLINTLSQQKLLKYDGEKQSFSWDLSEIKKIDFKLDAESKFNEVYEKLTDETRELINYISVFGSTYQDKSMDSGKMSFKMKPFIEAGILNESSDNTYTFKDGLFRIFVLNRMSPEKRKQLHYEIGKKLYKAYKDNADEWKNYCEIVTGHLNEAEELVSDDNEKLKLVYLNLESGNICLSSSNATNATLYYKKGIQIFNGDLFDIDYPLAVEIYLNCALSALAKDNREVFTEVSAALLQNIKTEEDKYKYYSLVMKQHISAGQYKEAIILGEKFLKGKGILYDEQPEPEKAYEIYEKRFFEELKTKPIQEFINLKRITDPEISHTGNILALLTDATWQTRDDRVYYYHFYTSCYAAHYGIFDDLETIFYNGALRLIRKMDYKGAENLIQICLNFVDRFGGLKTRAYIRYGSQISHWLYPIEKTFEIYKLAKAQAIKEGLNQETNIADLMAIDARIFMTGDPYEVSSEIDLSLQNASISGSDLNVKILSGVLRQFVKCITGKTSAPDSFCDANFKEDIFVVKNSNEPLIMFYYHTYKMIALVVNGYFSEAMTHAKSLESLWDVQSGSILTILGNFFYTFLLIKNAVINPESFDMYISAAKYNQKIMKEWAQLNPDNFLEWYLCAEIEIAIVEKEIEKVMKLYSQAFQIISNKKTRTLEAMLHEMMSAFWYSVGNKDYYSRHNQRAYELYEKLGFFSKIAQLKPKIASTLNLVTDTTSSYQSTGKPLTNKSLDLESVLNIVNTLNNDLDISIMSGKLLNCLIQNCGATKGFIVITQGSRPQITACYYSAVQAGNISANLLPMPLNKADELNFPIKAMEYVLSKKITLNINYATEKHLLFSDIYYKINNPESFICIPMLINDKAIGAVYLENSALAGVFSADRVNMISSIIMQTSAIFQNAIYYVELNNYAKTVEQRLKEHSNLLNSMIAGIAHEINTPVGVCVTVISHMIELTKSTLDKFNSLSLSKSELLNYFEEISKGTSIANANISRAVGLIQNFKEVSTNQSNEVFESINLYATLKNIIEYIRPAIKRKVSEIELMGDTDFTFISCAGSLTQVFTNLIMNSVVHGFENKSRESCVIKINYTFDKSTVTITYSDNGKGMTKEEVEKLFQPFYTTKRQFGGSGLGAHIIFIHVTQTLGGKIYCTSEPGKGAVFEIKIPISS